VVVDEQHVEEADALVEHGSTAVDVGHEQRGMGERDREQHRAAREVGCERPAGGVGAA
jgi:hypothetical protein